MEYVLFKDAPLPPSDNQLYRNVPKIGRVKTREYKTYEQSFHQWAWTQRAPLKALEGWKLSDTDPLALQLIFVLEPAQMYTKKGTIKRFDVQNRGKCFIDLFSKLLNFDDSKFFFVFFIKTTGPRTHVNAVVSPPDLKFFEHPLFKEPS